MGVQSLIGRLVRSKHLLRAPNGSLRQGGRWLGGSETPFAASAGRRFHPSRSQCLSVTESAGVSVREAVGPAGLNASAFDAIFDKFDADGNNELNIDELGEFLKEAFRSQALTQPEIASVLDALDADGDAVVSKVELRAFLRGFDPSSETLQRKTALVIIDVQNDFISGTLANQYGAAAIVPKINAIRDKFDFVVISYDWHPYDHCSFVESANAGKLQLHGQKKDSYTAFEPVVLSADDERPAHTQVMYPRHAVQDTEGGACHAELVVKDSDGKVYKGTKPNIDSYSAFFDNMKANDTGLCAMLEAQKVTDVYCCGLVFDICVMSTVGLGDTA